LLRALAGGASARLRGGVDRALAGGGGARARAGCAALAWVSGGAGVWCACADGGRGWHGIDAWHRHTQEAAFVTHDNEASLCRPTKSKSICPSLRYMCKIELKLFRLKFAILTNKYKTHSDLSVQCSALLLNFINISESLA
jgi:hypothetical protein